MYRLMQPSDEAAVVALWQKERGDSAEFIKTALEKFAGAENIYVAEENDEIAAAGLDVLCQEPMSETNPLRKIKDSKKLLITPHVAWASVEARTKLMGIILGQIKEYFQI